MLTKINNFFVNFFWFVYINRQLIKINKTPLKTKSVSKNLSKIKKIIIKNKFGFNNLAIKRLSYINKLNTELRNEKRAPII